MKRLLAAALVLTLLGVSSAWADAGATRLHVLRTADFEALVKQAGSVEKVDLKQLWEKAVFRDYAPEESGPGYRVEFKSDNRTFSLHVSRVGEKILYSISDMSNPAKPALVGAGAIRHDVKPEPGGEPFVVVLRSGNFKAQ